MNSKELENMETQVWDSLSEGPATDSPSAEDTQATKDEADNALPTGADEDLMPDDGNRSSDDGEGDGDGEAILDEDRTDGEETDDQEKEESGEDVKDVVPSIRLKETQRKMHQASEEAARYRKEAEEAKRQVAELQKRIDEGKAIPSSQLKLQALKERLTPEQRDFLDMNPELAQLQLAILEANDPKADSGKKADQPPARTPQEEHWIDYVTDKVPEFLVVRETPEFQKFKESNKPFVRMIAENYDDLDPRGAEKLYKAYQSWATKTSNRKTPSTTDRPAGKQIASPSGNRSGRPKSLARMEEDAWNSL